MIDDPQAVTRALQVDASLSAVACTAACPFAAFWNSKNKSLTHARLGRFQKEGWRKQRPYPIR